MTGLSSSGLRSACRGPAQVLDAVDRLMRLRSGERPHLRSRSDPYEVWRRMDRARPVDFGFDYLQDGPDRWRVQVTCRPAM